MVEGGGSKDFSAVKRLMFDQPRVMHDLLAKLAQAVTDYLAAQIQAGAQTVMLFDTWGGVLTTRDYRTYSLAYMARIIEGLRRGAEHVPVILFTKGGAGWLENMVEAGPDAIGVDWTIDLAEARRRIGDRAALQGNMDPCVLYASPERIRAEVETVLASYGRGNGHVFNLGHGIHPDVDPENVRVFIDSVHELSAPYHR
jgi:uroporphyrinogen decarboxylase